MSAADYIEGFVCTLKTCDVKLWGYVRYQPSLPGNAIFAGLFAILVGAQFYLWRKYRSGGTAIAMFIGLLGEIAGYIARVLLHGNPFDRNFFLWYLISLTIGPVFFAAAIYLTLGRIVVAYGEDCSRLRPATYTIIFLGCDVVSLVVQAVGGGIAASYPVTMPKMIDLGTNILVAGLSVQVASLFFFAACSIEFLIRAHRHRDRRNPEFASVVTSRKFKIFLSSLFLATALLFIRTVFRAVELSEGFSGELANNEVQFMILDGVMVVLACTCLTACHAGWGFQGRWRDANFHFHPDTRKAAADVENGSARSAEVGEVNEKGVVGHVRETRTEGL